MPSLTAHGKISLGGVSTSESSSHAELLLFTRVVGWMLPSQLLGGIQTLSSWLGAMAGWNAAEEQQQPLVMGYQGFGDCVAK